LRRKIILVFAVALATVGDVRLAPLADGGGGINGAVTLRKSRRIQADGFLLEWRDADAKAWPGGSKWLWDAVSTVDGIAGYVSLDGINVVPDSVNHGNGDCPEWLFTLRAVGADRSIDMKLPGPPAGEFFAFDRGAFDADGSITAEWIVPWELLDGDSDADAYELSLSAVSKCADTLPPIPLRVPAPGSPQPPGGLLIRLIMLAAVAVLTVALMIIRGRKKTEL
jgi:hypothetical protein